MSQSLVRLIDSLFSSILDDPPWVAFLESLEARLPCHYCTMVLRKPRDGDPGVLISAQSNSEALAVLQERIFRNSPFLELPLGQIRILSEMFTEDELKANYFEYYDYMRRYGNSADLIGIDLEEPKTGMIFRLRGARLVGEPKFGNRERRVLEAMLPRLKTAMALHARIALQQYKLSVSDQAVGQLAIASLVLNESGQVLLKNTIADQLLLQRDGFFLRDGVLHCTDAQSERELRRQLGQMVPAAEQRAHTAGIAASGSAPVKFLSGHRVPEDIAADASGGAPGDGLAGTHPSGAPAETDRLISVRRDRDGQSWSVLLRPSTASVGLDEKSSVTLLVLIRDANQKPEVSSAMLMELFGMTRAEAKLAELLVKGESLSAAAEALGRSRYTARAQLASIFTKTGIHRQPQLVSHILNTVKTVWT